MMDFPYFFIQYNLLSLWENQKDDHLDTFENAMTFFEH